MILARRVQPVGCLDLNDLAVEAPEAIIERVRGDAAFGTMRAMVAATTRRRPEFGGRGLLVSPRPG